MTTLPPPVAARTNRWALIAVIASVLSLGNVLVAGLTALGLPYRWLEVPRQHILWGLAQNCISTVFLAAASAGLILGVTAVVQCRASRGEERGSSAGMAAVVLALAAMFLPHVVRFVGGLFALMQIR